MQRLLEINTYRMLTLLALPLARQASPKLKDADRNIAAIAARMAEGRKDGGGNAGTDPELLALLSKVAADVEEIVASTSYRFDASRAYYGIVQRRLKEIREKRIEGLQTFSEFYDRRLTPAMNTCVSIAERQESLSQRAARVSSLLRARVEVALEQQNAALLESMDKRAKLQLRLQETVEGLSVVVLSYYTVSLVGYLLKGAKAVGNSGVAGNWAWRSPCRWWSGRCGSACNGPSAS